MKVNSGTVDIKSDNSYLQHLDSNDWLPIGKSNIHTNTSQGNTENSYTCT